MRFLAWSYGMVALLHASAASAAPDLSPARWPAEQRAEAEAREMAVMPTAPRLVSGSKAMVSATASPVAVRAGIEALRQGGTAADAAITTALTQIAMMAGANVSYAGVADLLYYDARTRRVHALSAGWNGWRGETAPLAIPAADISLITGHAPSPSTGGEGRKTLVPGFMAGMDALHRRFGRLPWRRLFDPAIVYAGQGVPVTPLLASYFSLGRHALQKTPEGKAFVMPDGAHLPTSGSRFVAPELAQTLRAVADHGARTMYSGDWARRFVATVRAHGGAASMADLAAYRPRWTEPMTVAFGDGIVVGPDSSNSGSCTILMALNLLNHAGAPRRYWQDARAFRDMALASRLALTAASSPEVAALDGALGSEGGCAAHLTPAFGAAAMARLDTLARARASAAPGHHSASVVVVDRWGNVAALLHSSNTAIWGDAGMVVGGIPLPLPAGIYQQRLATIAPGTRLPSDQSPVMLLRGGTPVLAVSAVGTSTHFETARLIRGLSVDPDLLAWASAPPLLFNIDQFTGPLIDRDELVPAGRYPEALLAALRDFGISPRVIDATRVATIKGTAAFVRLDRSKLATAEAPGVLTFAEGE